MINYDLNVVQAHSIGDAWREVMSLCVKNGWDFVVKGGSYEGQIRKQLENVMVTINNPGLRPLAPFMPPGLPAPTSDEKIDEYFERYILSDRKTENEVYTYGEFIVRQIDHIISVLNKAKGNTNQARIAIGDVGTTHLGDPPCLNSINFKVVHGKLNMAVLFRSWDLFAGFPENLGGMQLLKEFVLAHMTFPVTDGKIIAFSDGLHLYEQYFDLVNVLNVEKVHVSDEATIDKLNFDPSTNSTVTNVDVKNVTYTADKIDNDMFDRIGE